MLIHAAKPRGRKDFFSKDLVAEVKNQVRLETPNLIEEMAGIDIVHRPKGNAVTSTNGSDGTTLQR